MPSTNPAPLPPDFYTKTMENLRNLREIHDHDDTLHRFLGDAEAAIADLIVLEAETAKERDAAQADATRYALEADREKARAAAEEKHLRDVNEGLRERLAGERVDARAASKDVDRLTRERDALIVESGRVVEDLRKQRNAAENRAAVAVADRLAAIEVRDATRREAESGYLHRQVLAERNEARTDVCRLQKQVQEFSDCVYRLRAAFKCVPFEHVETGALRVVRERDGVARERDAAIKERDFARFHLESMEGIFKVAQDRLAELSKERDDLNRVLESSSHIHVAQKAKKAAEDERDAIQTRYDAIFAQSIHLAREVDRLKSEKAAEIEAAPEPITVAGRFKVGDRVINTEIVCHAANVLAFFDAIDGVRFVAVENDWRQSHFWRLDLVAKVNS